jgi:GT2 family glycosyltransferase
MAAASVIRPVPHGEVNTGERDVSVVVPTHQRREALRANLPGFLEMEDLLEVIVVVDEGEDDGTAAMVTGQFGHDDRVRLIRQPGRGLSPARNAGIAAARGEWIMVSDDDLRYPPDYARVLKAEARATDADIIGAPWLNITGHDAAEAAREARRRRGGVPTIDDHSVIPAEPLETPFMPAPALVSRRVYDEIRWDEGYGNTAWRDETDFFIKAMRAGFRCVLSPRTAMYQVAQYEGGCRRPRLEYEYTAIRNNWRFLRRHGRWLSDRGYIATPSRAQLKFAGSRMRMTLQGFLRGRLRAGGGVTGPST